MIAMINRNIFSLRATLAGIALGERLLADKRYEPALAALLEVVRRDRGALRTSARKLMVEVFKLAEDEAALVSEYRKLLAGALY